MAITLRNMGIAELDKIEITGKKNNRKIKCCYCPKIVNRSILPHIRKEHPKKWDEWKKEILDSYNEGLNPKQIMDRKFTTSSKPIFSWTVIEREIAKMIEEGYDIKLPTKEKIEKWESDEPDLINKLDKTTIWKFRKRGNWATHNGNYRGNWPPQIPRYFIEKYTKRKDWVFDGFMGGGTTIIECKLRGRNAIGYDINPYAVKLAEKQLKIIKKESKRQGIKFPPSKIKIKACDVRNLKSIKDDSIDLICTHPPYFNSLKYTQAIEGDLSRINDVDKFLDGMSLVAKEFFRVLKPKKTCAILIGDIRIKKNMYPLGFRIMDLFQKAGFMLKNTIIKEQYKDRSTAFWINTNIRRINHEYLFVFQKL